MALEFNSISGNCMKCYYNVSSLRSGFSHRNFLCESVLPWTGAVRTSSFPCTGPSQNNVATSVATLNPWDAGEHILLSDAPQTRNTQPPDTHSRNSGPASLASQVTPLTFSRRSQSPSRLSWSQHLVLSAFTLGHPCTVRFWSAWLLKKLITFMAIWVLAFVKGLFWYIKYFFIGLSFSYWLFSKFFIYSGYKKAIINVLEIFPHTLWLSFSLSSYLWISRSN